MVIEFVNGDSLESRLNQLLTARRGKQKLKIVSQHIHNASINGVSFRDKLEQLVRSQVKIIIVINRRVLTQDRTEQAFVEDLEENLGITVLLRRGVHAKMVLQEGQTNILLVSSLNITDTAIHKNKEAGIYVEGEQKTLIDDAHNYITTILGTS